MPRRFLLPLLALALFACSDDDEFPGETGGIGPGSGGASTSSTGQGGSGGAGAAGGAPSAGGNGGVPGTGGVPGSGGAAPMTCEEITAAYDALVGPANQTCEPTDMCKVLDGHCSGGLGGCFHIVNSSVSQADLDALYAEWQALDCMGPVCDCMPTPPGAGCEQGMCVPHRN